jgi:O-antigen/teichoic acid export membrane protein
MNALTTVYNILLTISMLICAWLYESILIVLMAQVVITAFISVVHFCYCWRNRYLSGFSILEPIDWQSFSGLLMYSLRTYAGVVGSALFSQGDKLIIGKLLGLETAGMYAAFTSMATQINTLSAIPVQPIVSRISGELKQEQTDPIPLILQLVRKALLLNTTIAIGIGSAIILMAPEIIALLFSNVHYVPFSLVVLLRLISLIYVLYSFNAVGYYALFALRFERINTFTTLLCGSGTLLLIGLLAWKYGLQGAILGNIGYLSTLYLLFRGLEKLNIKPGILWPSMASPIALFVLVIAVASLTDSLYWRITLGLLIGLLLIKPLLQEMLLGKHRLNAV